MVAPFGPVNVLNDTETPEAAFVAASITRLNETLSFRAPDRVTFVPSQARFRMVPVRFSTFFEARNSSRATLSPPSLAQMAEMELLAMVNGAEGVEIGVATGVLTGAATGVVTGVVTGVATGVVTGVATGVVTGVATGVVSLGKYQR